MKNIKWWQKLATVFMYGITMAVGVFVIVFVVINYAPVPVGAPAVCFIKGMEPESGWSPRPVPTPCPGPYDYVYKDFMNFVLLPIFSVMFFLTVWFLIFKRKTFEVK